MPLALLTASGVGLYSFFIKLGAGKIDRVLGAVVLQTVAAAIGCCLLLYLKLSGRTFVVGSTGLLYASLAGICIGVAEILTFAVFARGAPAGLTTPIIMGGSVLLTAILGVVILRERLSPAQIVGAILIAVGIALASVGRSDGL